MRDGKKTLASLIGNAVGESLVKSVTKYPDRPLTHVGFRWACAIALKHHWPLIDTVTAADWLAEYAGVPYGTEGYDWNYAAAQDLATQYASEFGEHQ